MEAASPSASTGQPLAALAASLPSHGGRSAPFAEAHEAEALGLAPPSLVAVCGSGGGGGVPTMGKQKAAMAGKPDPKNTRHALGDIGNIEANNQRPPWATSPTSNRKPQLHEPANRPVMRNFGSQLFKNAQEKRAHVKPVPPPPEHVIEISSDTDVTKSEADSVSSVHKDPGVQDIDKLDGDFAVVDYIEDIYKFYKFAEILEVHQKFDLMSESLYLTFYIIDMSLLLQRHAQADTPRHHTSFTEAQLMDAAKILIGGHGLKL
ncbi:hypothetical protein ZWY2020_044453 [Hordeum vulgare]|nr:hypothetical protein ZWY2020_044453 [Hordeum vulgare]